MHTTVKWIGTFLTLIAAVAVGGIVVAGLRGQTASNRGVAETVSPNGTVTASPTSGAAQAVGPTPADTPTADTGQPVASTADSGLPVLPTYALRPFRLRYSSLYHEPGRAVPARPSVSGSFVYHDASHYYGSRQEVNRWLYRREEHSTVEYGNLMTQQPERSYVTTTEFHTPLPRWVRRWVKIGVSSYEESLGISTGFYYPLVSHADLVQRLSEGRYRYAGLDEVMQRQCILVDIQQGYIGSSGVGDRACVGLESGVFLRYIVYNSDGSPLATYTADDLEFGGFPLEADDARDLSEYLHVELASWDVSEAAAVDQTHGGRVEDLYRKLQGAGAKELKGTYLVGDNYLLGETLRAYGRSLARWTSSGERAWAAIFDVTFGGDASVVVLVGEGAKPLPFDFWLWPDADENVDYPLGRQFERRPVRSSIELPPDDELPPSMGTKQVRYDRATTWLRGDGVRIMVIYQDSSSASAMRVADLLGYVPSAPAGDG